MPHDPIPHDSMPDDSMPDDLSHAGAIVDQAIGFMTKQNLSGLAMASALLGAALTMLSRSLPEGDVIRILAQAQTSVRTGEFRDRDQADA